MMPILDFHGIVFDRKEFVSWMGGTKVPQTKLLAKLNLNRDLKGESCALLWRLGVDENSARPVIVIPEGNTTSFFAFVSTYMPGYYPYSAFFRVVGLPDFELLGNSHSHDSRQLPSEAVGIAMAEAALREGGRKTPEKLKVGAIRSTLSSALLTAAFQGNRSEAFIRLAEMWQTARRLVGEDDTSTSVATCLAVVTRFAIALSGDGDDEIARSIRQARASGTVSFESWRSLVYSRPELTAAYELLRGPREERLKNARTILKDLVGGQNNLGTEDLDCIAGCIIALVGDGSFLYLPLAIDLGRQRPGSILWFAAWSSLFSSTDILTHDGAVGRRVARDIFRPFDLVDTPAHDVGVAELANSTAEFGQQEFDTHSSSSLLVEIFPGVNSLFEIKRPQFDYQSLEVDIEELIDIDRWLDRAREGVARAISKKQRRFPESTDRSRRKR